MAKIRYLSRCRLQASDPRRKEEKPYGKWYYDADIGDYCIQFKTAKEARDWLDADVLRNTGIDLKKSRGER